MYAPAIEALQPVWRSPPPVLPVPLPVSTIPPQPKDKLIEVFLESQRCSGDNSPTAPPDDPAPHSWSNSPEELDILEAVFRYQFEHNASSATALNDVDYLFVALGDSASMDPPAELMAQFADHSPPVESVSAGDTSGHGVEHKEHGGQGIILRIERIRRIDADTMDVDGGYYEANLSASGNTYRVKRRDGSWEVVCDAMWWIS